MAIAALICMPTVFAILAEFGWSGIFIGEAMSLAGWLAWRKFGIV